MKTSGIVAALVLSASLVFSALIFQRAVRDEIASREQQAKRQAQEHQLWLQHRAALVVAINQLHSWEIQCSTKAGLNWGKLLPLYRSLDVSKCPIAFRTAFFDFLSIKEAQRRHGQLALIELGAAVVTSGTSEVATEMLGAAAKSGADALADDPVLAMQRVQHFWVEYDITQKDIQ